jgi:hypothetical protein
MILLIIPLKHIVTVGNLLGIAILVNFALMELCYGLQCNLKP